MSKDNSVPPEEEVAPENFTPEQAIEYLHANGFVVPEEQELTPAILNVLHSFISQLNHAHEIGGMDELTGLKTRRELKDQLEKEVEKHIFKPSGLWQRKAVVRPTTLVNLDLNFLKSVNDDSGISQRAGDIVLKGFAEFLTKHLRDGDIIVRPGKDPEPSNGKAGSNGHPATNGNNVVARHGGDEFFVIMHDITPDEARKRLEELREEFRNKQFPYQDKRDGKTVDLELFDTIRTNVKEGRSTIPKDDERYTPPEKAHTIVPSFAFGCVEISREIFKGTTNEIVERLKETAEKEMKKDKITWKERQNNLMPPVKEKEDPTYIKRLLRGNRELPSWEL